MHRLLLDQLLQLEAVLAVVAEELVAEVEERVVVQVPVGAVGVAVLVQERVWVVQVGARELVPVKLAVAQVLQTGIQRNMQMQCRQL